MNFNLYNHTILLTLGGSRAYGIETLTSDWDYRGLCIPPLRSYFVQPYFEQAVDKEEKNFGKIILKLDKFQKCK